MAHIPVLLNESMEALDIKQGGVYADGTIGGFGHASEIIKRMETGIFIGIDKDAEMIERASAIDVKAVDIILTKGCFSDIKNILRERNIDRLDGMLLDIGMSSFMVDIPQKGFSYMSEGPLDMRFDEEAALTAYDVVNTYDKERLSRIIKSYGGERWANRIAAFIIDYRPVNTTLELVSIIKKAIPKKAREKEKHPAKRTFQAIRIEVNNELLVLKNAIYNITDALSPSGRLVIITFHSLESKVVREAFKYLSTDCICPREFPVCVCDKERKLKIIAKKPIIPSEDEIARNHRARSALLWIAERV